LKPAVLSLLDKDLSEHTFPLTFLGAGYALISLIILARAVSSAMDSGVSVGFYYIVLALTPLVAFIVGNRLIVREYIGKTRLFVEALPVAMSSPLIIKFVMGFVYMALLTSLGLLITMGMDSDGDISPSFAGLLLIKSITLVFVLWSIVFSVSLFGRLRLILYLVIGATLYYLLSSPSIDADRFGPLALLDFELFAFERDIVPWMQIIQSVITGIVIAGIGFALALFNEGSLTESLAKPMNRRDFVALTIVGFAALVIFPVLTKDWKKTPYSFSGEQVVRSEWPPIAIRFNSPKQKPIAQSLLKRLKQTLQVAQRELGIAQVPSIRISMDTSLSTKDVNMWTRNGVIIEANYGEYDSYQNTVLEAHVLHGVFQRLTDNRAVFEPRHWLTDGLTRYWATTPLTEKDRREHAAQVFARAIFALDRSPLTPDLITNWQLVADVTGLIAAEALAFTAIEFFLQTHGNDPLTRLARANLTEPIPTGFRGPLNDRSPAAQERFESIVGESWNSFMQNWRQWLSDQRKRPDVAEFLALIPAITGVAAPHTNQDGVLTLDARFEPLADFDSIDELGTCEVNHKSIGAFDWEIWLNTDNRLAGECTLDGVAQRISQYARQLLPIGLMWVAIDLLSWGAEIFSNRLDEQTYSDWCSVVCDPGVSWTLAITVLIIAVVIGYSLFPREFDDATINFLRGMPITPAQIFIAKYAAALILSAVMIVFGVVVIELLMWTNPQSLIGTNYRDNTLLLALRDFIALAVMIAYGIFLSRFRTVGLVIMLALLAALGWLENVQGYSPAWSPIEMFRVEYFGQSIELPWFALLTNAGVGLVILLVSYRMWSNTEATSVARDGTISAKGSWFAALGAIGALAVITVIAVALVSPDKRGSKKTGIETEYYKFRFHPYLQAKADTFWPPGKAFESIYRT